MLAFPIFWVLTSVDYYSSRENKYPTFYARMSYFFKMLQFTDTNE